MVKYVKFPYVCQVKTQPNSVGSQRFTTAMDFPPWIPWIFSPSPHLVPVDDPEIPAIQRQLIDAQIQMRPGIGGTTGATRLTTDLGTSQR